MKPLLDRCASLLRGFDQWRIDRLKVCFYTVTDDERFVVEKQGARGWVMSPCSGHGFKFGALMGRELARTIVSERDPAAARALGSGSRRRYKIASTEERKRHGIPQAGH